jgi:hypothetical protein
VQEEGVQRLLRRNAAPLAAVRPKRLVIEPPCLPFVWAPTTATQPPAVFVAAQVFSLPRRRREQRQQRGGGGSQSRRRTDPAAAAQSGPTLELPDFVVLLNQLSLSPPVPKADLARIFRAVHLQHRPLTLVHLQHRPAAAAHGAGISLGQFIECLCVPSCADVCLAALAPAPGAGWR